MNSDIEIDNFSSVDIEMILSCFQYPDIKFLELGSRSGFRYPDIKVYFQA